VADRRRRSALASGGPIRILSSVSARRIETESPATSQPAESRPHPIGHWYPEVSVGGFTHVDATVAFYARINSLLRPSSVVLDIGCGRGAAVDDPVPWRRDLQRLKGKCARVMGADVDPGAADNPWIDEFHLIVGDRLPLNDASADLCFADAVVEHLENVDVFFSECSRVLRPGGHLLVRTPNTWNYATVATRLVPNRFHARVLARVQPSRKEEDVFPTVYQCNTARKLRRQLERHGMEAVVVPFESEPAYLSFSRGLSALVVLHQRYAPLLFRPTLMAFGTKR
jgi:SAM-dependent methyltransferase